VYCVFFAPIIFPSTLSLRERDIGSYVYGRVKVMNMFSALIFCGYLRRKIRVCFRIPARYTYLFFLGVLLLYVRTCEHMSVFFYSPFLLLSLITRVCVHLSARCTFLLFFFNVTSRVRTFTGALYMFIILLYIYLLYLLDRVCVLLPARYILFLSATQTIIMLVSGLNWVGYLYNNIRLFFYLVLLYFIVVSLVYILLFTAYIIIYMYSMYSMGTHSSFVTFL
jgi:hypothetical protein